MVDAFHVTGGAVRDIRAPVEAEDLLMAQRIPGSEEARYARFHRDA